MSDDEFEKQVSLSEEISSGDMRRSLIAIRDYLAHELEGHRCNRCAMSQLRTGDTAALVLRLTKVLEDLAALPDPAKAGEKSGLAKLRSIHGGAGGADSTDPSSPERGTKSGPRRQGGRRTS